jgi:hypothetical protein
MTCAHYSPDVPCCARGINYQALAGGGAFYMVLRLPCLPISNRRGEQAKMCAQHSDNEKEANVHQHIHQ